jgi:hypothetical protein
LDNPPLVSSENQNIKTTTEQRPRKKLQNIEIAKQNKLRQKNKTTEN